MQKNGILPLAGERLSGESLKAVQACNDYLRLGPARSFSRLAERYTQEPELAPTLSRLTIQSWGLRFGWQARAEQYDIELERLKNERAALIMATGLALDFERVAKLKELFDRLEAELNQGALWLLDVKQIGAGEYAERVEIQRYNSPLIGDIRGLLDDIAKETGGRVTRADVTSKGKELGIIGIEIVAPGEPEESFD